jgi:hypothetical protein
VGAGRSGEETSLAVYETLDLPTSSLERIVVDQVGSEVSQRRKHEPPLPHSRVRDLQVGLVDFEIPDQKDIHVEGPRAVFDRPDTPRVRLEASRELEQLARRLRRRDLYDHVQVWVLARRSAHRSGLVDRRDLHDAWDGAHGGLKQSHPVPEVRPEAKKRPDRGHLFLFRCV